MERRASSLTTNIETINVSGQGVNTVNGVQQNTGSTWNSGDVINGNGKTIVALTANGNPGNDPLNASVVDANNIAAINANLIADTTINGTEFTNVAAVNVTNGVATKILTASEAALATTYGINAAKQVTVNVDYAGSLAGTADTALLSAAGAGVKAGTTATFEVGTLNDNAIDVVNLKTSGANFVTLNAGTGAKNITVTGSGANNITLGSAASAALKIDLSGTTGANTFDAATFLNTTTTVVGGSGVDTLAATVAGSMTPASITAIDALRLNITNDAATFSARNVTGVETLTIASTANGGTVNNLNAAVDTINIGYNAAVSTTGKTTTVAYTTGSDSDLLTVNVGATSTSSDPAVATGNLVISNNAADLVVNSIGDAANTIASITNSKATSVTLDAVSQALTVSGNIEAAKATEYNVNATAKDITVGGEFQGSESLATVNVTAAAGAVKDAGDIALAASTTKVAFNTEFNVASSATKTAALGSTTLTASTSDSDVTLTYNVNDTAAKLASMGGVALTGSNFATTSRALDVSVNATAIGGGTGVGNVAVLTGDDQDGATVTATLNATGGDVVVDGLSLGAKSNAAYSTDNVLTVNATATGSDVEITTLGAGAERANDEVSVNVTAIATGEDDLVDIRKFNATENTGVISLDTATFSGAGTIRFADEEATAEIDNDAYVYASGMTGQLIAVFNGSSSADITVQLGNAAADLANNVTTGAGADFIQGGTGADILQGRAGVDTLMGAAGNDTFVVAGSGEQVAGDVISGGTGTNTIQIANAAVTATFDFDNISDVLAINTVGTANGTRAITFAAIAETTAQTVVLDASSITGGTGTLSVTNSAASATTTFNITGGANADSIAGSNGADTLTGGAGGDTIAGGAGADLVTGGTGADRVDLGTGVDRALITTTTDTGVSTVNAEAMSTVNSDVYLVTAGDVINLAGGITSAHTLGTESTNFTLTVTAGEFEWARGTYDATANAGAGSFTQDNAGLDVIVYWAADTATTATQAVVLVGTTAVTLSGTDIIAA